MKKILLASLAIGLAGAGCAPFAEPVTPVTSTAAPQAVPATSSSTQTPPRASASASNSIKLESQQKGSTIVVDDVTLTKPGYIVIHQDTNGKPGLILATSDLLPAGESQHKTITLPLGVGKTFWAEIRTDNGDGKWNEAMDLAAASSTDSSTIVSFHSPAK